MRKRRATIGGAADLRRTGKQLVWATFSPGEKARIKAAAARAGLSMAAFVRNAALARATDPQTPI